MRLSIADVNRINTCGILYKNNWDYEKGLSSSPSYLIGMKEVLRWHYKRRKPIDIESFMTFFSNLNTKFKLEYEEKINLETAFRSFINSVFYLNMKNVYINYLTDIKINKIDVLEHVVPCFLNNLEKPTFIYYDSEEENTSLFLQRYDVMHNAVWAFYNLGKVASFLRISFNGKEIKRENVKIDQNYILSAKRNLITIGQNTNISILPPVQTCRRCSMIDSCLRFNKKHLKKRVKDGTTTK